MKNQKDFTNNAGFTFIETLIGLAIILIVATIFASSLSVFKESGQLDESQSRTIGMLRDARNRTLASEANSSYGVHFEATKIATFRGSAYNPSDSLNEYYILPSLITISNISLVGGSDVLFQRLSGTTTNSGNVTIQSKNNASRTRTITIYRTGNTK